MFEFEAPLFLKLALNQRIFVFLFLKVASLGGLLRGILIVAELSFLLKGL